MDLETLITFVLASFTLTISPGPDILYVISQSIIKGKKSAFMISLGLTTGLLVHTFLVAVGLSVIISQNENILNMIKLLSVFYFFYLIVMVFLKRNDNLKQSEEGFSENQFKKGLIMNLLNPKVSLFFIAFFPNFLFHDQISNQIQFLILGLIFWLQATIIFLLVSVFSSKFASISSKKSFVNKNIYIIEISIYLFIIYWIVG
ncbi:LysE family translocator [Flavobacteriaceae bacterium]|nr:LysE family translocator [Flavobacteriaceae bacterium]